MKILILIAFFSIVAITKSQTFDLGVIQNSKMPDINNVIPILDNDISKIKASDILLAGSKDTLDDYLKRSNGYAYYGVTIQGNTYPLTGWNPMYLYLGSKFVPNGSVTVKEILIATAIKALRGASEDSMRIFIFPGEPTHGLPTGSPIAMGSFFISQVDSNSTTPIFSSIKIDDAVTTDQRFVILLLTNNGTNEYDALIIYSNLQGDGNNENTACLIFNQQGQAASIDFSSFWGQLGLRMQDGNPPNFDIMMFPIVETSTSGVEDNASLNGLTINSVSPNPSASIVKLEYLIDKPASPEISIIDASGKLIKKIQKSELSSGNNSEEIDFTDYSSGSYYITINCGYSKIGTRVNIIK